MYFRSIIPEGIKKRNFKLFGTSLKQQIDETNRDIPDIVESCAKYIAKYGRLKFKRKMVRHTNAHRSLKINCFLYNIFHYTVSIIIKSKSNVVEIS